MRDCRKCSHVTLKAALFRNSRKLSNFIYKISRFPDREIFSSGPEKSGFGKPELAIPTWGRTILTKGKCTGIAIRPGVARSPARSLVKWEVQCLFIYLFSLFQAYGMLTLLTKKLNRLIMFMYMVIIHEFRDRAWGVPSRQYLPFTWRSQRSHGGPSTSDRNTLV